MCRIDFSEALRMYIYNYAFQSAVKVVVINNIQLKINNLSFSDANIMNFCRIKQKRRFFTYNDIQKPDYRLR